MNALNKFCISSFKNLSVLIFFIDKSYNLRENRSFNNRI
ncbi:unknown protein [Parachlamydia acanthamoebae UV-7]|uniref:Uncharacterized protein n=1 Tax=Parachlamydia acanthamoebae (strain UV7) TaxID=765952 RepID=F8KV36_PARAV|nr:unknown protein [Parachlamydia acanthamoebae UV-7]